MEIHRQARKHGVSDSSILHAISHALVAADIGHDESTERVLLIGTDSAGNMLEIVVLRFDDSRQLVIHAMPLRPRYHYLLPRPDSPTT